jgi:NAD(P)-dependent dehydrogenase (short-subunit alcohol dehydrogenase family)
LHLGSDEEGSVADTPTTTTTDVLDGVDLSGRTVLVTGGTTGIGKETARALAAAGASVTVTARTDDKGAAAVDELRTSVPDAEVDYEVLELGSLASVRAFTDRFTATHDSLDVLIANAGVMAVPFGRTDDGFELHFGTNHLGHFVLVGRLLPLVGAGGAARARVVVLTSAGHAMSDIDWDDPNYEHRPYSKMEAYGQSKTANILHALELDRRAGASGVHAYSVHPGMVATELGRYFTREDFEELKGRAARSSSSSSGGGGGGLPTAVGVDVGASTSVWAATAPELDDEGGAYLADCAVATPMPYAVDPDAARRLWSLSEQLVGEQFPEPT